MSRSGRSTAAGEDKRLPVGGCRHAGQAGSGPLARSAALLRAGPCWRPYSLRLPVSGHLLLLSSLLSRGLESRARYLPLHAIGGAFWERWSVAG